MDKKNENKKIDLLRHYNLREPVKFIQYDVFTKGFDSIVIPDKDGYSLFRGTTEELMTGAYTIRALIIPDTKKEIVIKGLKKVIEWVEREPGLLKWDREFLRGVKNMKKSNKFYNIGDITFHFNVIQFKVRYEIKELIKSRLVSKGFTLNFGEKEGDWVSGVAIIEEGKRDDFDISKELTDLKIEKKQKKNKKSEKKDPGSILKVERKEL